MGELINGRTPEEIKRWVDGRATCNTCPKEHEVGCEYGERTEDCQMTIDTITYIERLEATLDRLGDFGKLFADYTGCPRGATGRAALPIEEEVLAMKPIRDVDNGEWIPVNADALRELVAKYKQLRDAVPKWISVEERMPEHGTDVLVLTAPGTLSLGKNCVVAEYIHPRMEKSGVFINFYAGYDDKNILAVTHWMPLPEPPDGGKSNEDD